MSEECKDTFDAAFKFIESRLTSATNSAYNMTAKSAQEGTMRITFNTGSFVINASDIPCFVEGIPEIMTIYIVAQLLKIARATTPAEIETAALKAAGSINAKIAVLHQMNQEFHVAAQ